MLTAKIWHASGGRKFPLELTSAGNFSLGVQEIFVKDLTKVSPDPDHFHIFVIQGDLGSREVLKQSIIDAKSLFDFPKIVILPEADYNWFTDQPPIPPRTFVFDDSLRSNNMKMIVESVLQLEYYRRIIHRLSNEYKKQNSAFDHLIDLSRNEARTLKEESKAYQHLLDFEQSRKKFGADLEKAMLDLMGLRDREMLSLKAQLDATEKLSVYRDRELKEAYAQTLATEQALNLSHRENLEREKIITAMDRLRSFTEKELLSLYNENLELRKKLGLPPRDI